LGKGGTTLEKEAYEGERKLSKRGVKGNPRGTWKFEVQKKNHHSEKKKRH